MYKIAKNEILYWRPVLLWVLGMDAAIIIIASLRFSNNLHVLYEIVGSTTNFLILILFILNIFFTCYEMRESRLRIIAGLPVSYWKIGIARILTILLLNGIFICVFVLALYINTVIEVRYISTIDTNVNIPFRTEHYYTYFNEMLEYLDEFILFWLLIVYAVRLFTELYGRILLGIVLIVNLIVYAILPIINWNYAQKVVNNIGHIVYRGNSEIYFMTGCIILLWILLYLSFVNRKSYIAL